MCDFDLFWSVYPRRVAKGDARKAWVKLNPDHELVDAILEALAWQCKQVRWQEDGGQWVPYPATWLRAERWTDEPFEAKAPSMSDRIRAQSTWLAAELRERKAKVT